MMAVTVQIEGVSVTELRQIKDERGSVLHMLRADAPDFSRFGECYFSEVLPGAFKAWKRHQMQTQNIAVPIGRLRLVIFDDRPSSATQGMLDDVELGRPDAYCRICIPPHLWYGFSCISKTPALLVNCSDIPHNPADNEICSPSTSRFPYDWSMHREDVGH